MNKETCGTSTAPQPESHARSPLARAVQMVARRSMKLACRLLPIPIRWRRSPSEYELRPTDGLTRAAALIRHRLTVRANMRARSR
jgi:hypothetical protein